MLNRRRFILSIIAAPFGAALARLARRRDTTEAKLSIPSEPPAPVWVGDPLDHTMTLRNFIHSFPEHLYWGHNFTSELEFLYGNQWSAADIRRRSKQERPVLVINQVRKVMNRAAHNSWLHNEKPLSKQEETRAVAAIVWRNRVPQQLFNYHVSCIVEWRNSYERGSVLYVDREHPTALAVDRAMRLGQI